MAFSVKQTAVSQFPDSAYPGMRATFDGTVDTGIAAAAMDCGIAVVGGTTHDDVKLPALGTDVTNKLRGFTLYDAAREPKAAGAVRYAAKDAVPVLRRGRIWVLVEGAALVTDGPVYVVNGSGAGTPGRVRGDANTAAATLAPGVICRIGAAPGALAQIEVNLP